MIRIYLLIGAVAVVGLGGYRLGYGISEGRHAAALAEAQARAFEAADLASRKEAERLALETQRDALARELDAAAYADPDAGRAALSADSVRRLRNR